MGNSVKGSGFEADSRVRTLSELKRYYSARGLVTALGQVAGLEDPFRVLIATVLSQRTKDEETARAEKALFDVFADAAGIAKASRTRVEKLIRNVGFYRTKAVAVREIAGIVLEKFGGKVPDDLDSLLSLPMVGRKTANCVLVFGFGRAAIPVDTHVHRISNRLGWVRTVTPEETERALQKILPERVWLDVNELMVTHGRNICRPVKPLCTICPIIQACAFASGRGMDKSTAHGKEKGSRHSGMRH